MGRGATVAAGNVWYEARIEAAKWNEKLYSRDGASEVTKITADVIAAVERGTHKSHRHIEDMRGRKIPKGTEGLVFWTGIRYNQYSRRNEDRVGIEVDGERMFLPAEYVERMNWEEHLLTGKTRKREIRNFAINSMPAHYRSRFVQWS